MLTREFVLPFREAAPYIHTFRGKAFVIALSDDTVHNEHFRNLAQDINLLITLGIRIVLVHGIDSQIDRLLPIHTVTPRFHHQHRITDLPLLNLIKQAIGLIRHDIEATLSMGMPNSPMHGSCLRIAGGNMLTAKPLGVLSGVDMQYTGQIRRIDTQAMTARLDMNELVLLSPIGYSPTGEAFSLTMEEVAAATAIALKAEKLIFLTHGRGVTSLDNTHCSILTAQQAENLLDQGYLTGESATYLPYLIKASREGVARTHLVSRQEEGALLTELFTNRGIGTMIARDPLVKIRKATINDIGDILALICPLEEQGILVRRSRERLEMEVHQYSVLEHNTRIYGCIAMHPFPDAHSAELACLAIMNEQRNAGFGEMLLHHVERQARAQHLASLFVLTTQTEHWFVERGFIEAKISDLPLSRQRLYNYQRRSKIFIKML